MNPTLPIRVTLAFALLLSAATTLPASNWPQWRGPQFNGSTDVTGLPSHFSPSEAVKWAADMPGPAAATPIVWEDRVFVSSTDKEQRTLLAMCLDRQSGRILWKETVGPGFSQDDRSNYASPSPATDGERVVFFYGNGELITFDLAGKQLWSRNLQKDYGPFAFQWTFSTSPLLYQGKLYMQVLQRDVPANGRGNRNGPNESYLLALDPKTGKELWKVVRPSEARAESLEAFTTPIPYPETGQLLVAGGDCLTGHDPVTGKEIWRWGTWNPTRIGHWRLVPSPVTGQDTILACAPKKSPIYAVKAGLKGDHGENALRWTSAERGPVSSDVSTPLYYKGSFFVLNSDERSISRVDPQSGRVQWTGELPSRAKIETSPTGADNKIYTMNMEGHVFVVGTGDSFELLHQADFGEENARDIRSTIAIAHGQLFIRTESKLYCVGL